MQKIDVASMMHIATVLGAMSAYIEQHKDTEDAKKPISKEMIDDFLEQCDELLTISNQMRLDLTNKAAARHKKFLQTTEEINWYDLSRQFDDIRGRLRDEIDLSFIYFVDKNKSAFLDASTPAFGSDVDTAFPSAAFEIQEASKCYALGLSTASVFHLMRVMEIALNAIARSLGIPNVTSGQNKNWGAILANIKSAMDAKNNPSTWQHNDKELFKEFYVSLDAVRAAWRNTTMHVENKYTSEEAEHIFTTVRAFMKKVANRLDEHGQPPA